MSKEKINQILNDLYSADPSLKQDEDKLIHIIRELLEARPDAHMDETFKRELHNRLQSFKRVERMAPSAPLRYAGVAGGFFALILLVYGITTLRPGTQFNGVKVISSNTPHAFGDLAINSAPQGANDAGMRETAIGAPMGMGGGGSAPATMNSAVSSLETPVSLKMIAQYPTNYTYIYNGDPITLPGDEVSVYRRAKAGSAKSAAGILRGFDLGAINLSSFQNLSVENISLAENKDYGYIINISFVDESISIYENWEYWNMPQGSVVPASAPNAPLSASDVPTDSTLISMATNFLKSHGISLSTYGAPVVMNQWRQMYAMAKTAEEKSSIYVPDSIAVVYPLKINDQIVYDQGGNPSGLTVNINIRQDKVSGLYELKTNIYDESKYAAETSTDRILKIAQNGGYNNYPILYSENGDNGITTVKIELGTPTLELVRVWNYKNNESEELIVPAFVFPIKSQIQSPYFYRQNVIVPIVKDILDQQGGIAPDGPIRILEKPMPMDSIPTPDPANK